MITELDIGGAEKSLVSLATGLNKERWSIRVFALGPEAPLATPLRNSGIAVTCLDVSPRNPVRALYRLTSALRKQRPALIQSFLFHANIATRFVAPMVAGKPCLVGGIRVAEREKLWHLRLDRLTIPLCNGAVCVSEGVRRFSKTVGGWPEERLVVIPNGVDPTPIDQAEPIPREQLGIPREAFLALFVGRLEIQKGVMNLLDAVERLLPDCPDFHIGLAGEGPERRHLTERLSRSPKLAANIHVLGPRRDVPALLKTADLFVLPSLWEGMPNALLESMVAGIPAVATRVEGTEELIKSEETGWLVPPNDPQALATAMQEAMKNRNRLKTMGERARSIVLASFTPERVVEEYERLWNGLLGFESRVDRV